MEEKTTGTAPEKAVRGDVAPPGGLSGPQAGNTPPKRYRALLARHNIRQRPALDAPAIGALAAGDVAAAHGCGEEGWAELEDGGYIRLVGVEELEDGAPEGAAEDGTEGTYE